MERSATLANPIEQSSTSTEIQPIPTYGSLNQRKPSIFNLLTDRELDVVTLTLAGYTAVECAAKAGTEPGTVELHRKNIKAKAEQLAGEKGKPK